MLPHNPRDRVLFRISRCEKVLAEVDEAAVPVESDSFDNKLAEADPAHYMRLLEEDFGGRVRYLELIEQHLVPELCELDKDSQLIPGAPILAAFSEFAAHPSSENRMMVRKTLAALRAAAESAPPPPVPTAQCAADKSGLPEPAASTLINNQSYRHVGIWTDRALSFRQIAKAIEPGCETRREREWIVARLGGEKTLHMTGAESVWVRLDLVDQDARRRICDAVNDQVKASNGQLHSVASSGKKKRKTRGRLR